MRTFGLVKPSHYNEQIASEFPVNIITTDRYGASSEQNFTITVMDLNDSPILGDFVFDEENSGFNVQAGDLVNQALYISDPDKVDTRFQIVTFDAPDWLVLYNMAGLVDEDAGYSHRIIAPTSIENIGSYPITISVEDERGAFSEKTYELIVEDSSVILENSAPVLEKINDAETSLNDVFSIQLNVSDVDIELNGDSVNF